MSTTILFMSYRIVSTNITTENLDVKLHKANNYDSIIEVYYTGGFHFNDEWHGVITGATKNDEEFYITIDPLDNDNKNNGYSVQGLSDEIGGENLPVKIIINDDDITDNIMEYDFVSNYTETTLYLL